MREGKARRARIGSAARGRGTAGEDGTHCSAHRERGGRWLPSPQGVQLLGIRLLEVQLLEVQLLEVWLLEVRLLEVRRTQPECGRIYGA